MIEQRTEGGAAIELTATGWRVQVVNGDAASLRNDIVGSRDNVAG
jgi:hypothetical protein